MGSGKRIGVLAVQGAFARHAELLTRLGHEVRALRKPDDFAELDGLVLPGGESTVQLALIARLGLRAPLCALATSSRPVLATCAGLILLARGVAQPEQESFGIVDVDVVRNAWGRQLESFEAQSDAPLPSFAPQARERASESGARSPQPAGAEPQAARAGERLPLVFIRAPRIARVGPDVEVLARFRAEPVLVRASNVTCATFHPELSADARVHALVFG